MDGCCGHNGAMQGVRRHTGLAPRAPTLCGAEELVAVILCQRPPSDVQCVVARPARHFGRLTGRSGGGGVPDPECDETGGEDHVRDREPPKSTRWLAGVGVRKSTAWANRALSMPVRETARSKLAKGRMVAAALLP